MAQTPAASEPGRARPPEESASATAATKPDNSAAAPQDVPAAGGALAADGDAVRPVAVGTIAWLVALVVLLLQRDELVTRDREWWLWVCVAGALLGVAGLVYTTRRRAAYRARGLQP